VGEGGDPDLEEVRFHSLLQLQVKMKDDLMGLLIPFRNFMRNSAKQTLLQEVYNIVHATQPGPADGMKNWVNSPGYEACFNGWFNDFYGFWAYGFDITDKDPLDRDNLTSYGPGGIARSKIGRPGFQKPKFDYKPRTIPQMINWVEQMSQGTFNLNGLFDNISLESAWVSPDPRVQISAKIEAKLGYEPRSLIGDVTLDCKIKLINWKNLSFGIGPKFTLHPQNGTFAGPSFEVQGTLSLPHW